MVVGSYLHGVITFSNVRIRHTNCSGGGCGVVWCGAVVSCGAMVPLCGGGDVVVWCSDVVVFRHLSNTMKCMLFILHCYD